MNTDTSDFLAALLFAMPENDEGEIEHSDKSIHDFSPEFISGVESFIDGFKDYLSEREIEIPESKRSFGGNVYFSLSGHGVGFWDGSDTEHLQAPLEAYSGNRYRFEQIDLSENEKGELDISILPESIDWYRENLFRVA